MAPPAISAPVPRPSENTKAFRSNHSAARPLLKTPAATSTGTGTGPHPAPGTGAGGTSPGTVPVSVPVPVPVPALVPFRRPRPRGRAVFPRSRSIKTRRPPCGHSAAAAPQTQHDGDACNLTQADGPGARKVLGPRVGPSSGSRAQCHFSAKDTVTPGTLNAGIQSSTYDPAYDIFASPVDLDSFPHPPASKSMQTRTNTSKPELPAAKTVRMGLRSGRAIGETGVRIGGEASSTPKTPSSFSGSGSQTSTSARVTGRDGRRDTAGTSASDIRSRRHSRGWLVDGATDVLRSSRDASIDTALIDAITRSICQQLRMFAMTSPSRRGSMSPGDSNVTPNRTRFGTDTGTGTSTTSITTSTAQHASQGTAAARPRRAHGSAKEDKMYAEPPGRNAATTGPAALRHCASLHTISPLLPFRTEFRAAGLAVTSDDQQRQRRAGQPHPRTHDCIHAPGTSTNTSFLTGTSLTSAGIPPSYITRAVASQTAHGPHQHLRGTSPRGGGTGQASVPKLDGLWESDESSDLATQISFAPSQDIDDWRYALIEEAPARKEKKSKNKKKQQQQQQQGLGPPSGPRRRRSRFCRLPCFPRDASSVASGEWSHFRRVSKLPADFSRPPKSSLPPPSTSPQTPQSPQPRPLPPPSRPAPLVIPQRPSRREGGRVDEDAGQGQGEGEGQGLGGQRAKSLPVIEALPQSPTESRTQESELARSEGPRKLRKKRKKAATGLRRLSMILPPNVPFRDVVYASEPHLDHLPSGGGRAGPARAGQRVPLTGLAQGPPEKDKPDAAFFHGRSSVQRKGTPTAERQADKPRHGGRGIDPEHLVCCRSSRGPSSRCLAPPNIPGRTSSIQGSVGSSDEDEEEQVERRGVAAGDGEGEGGAYDGDDEEPLDDGCIDDRDVLRGLHIAASAACDEEVDAFVRNKTGLRIRRFLADLMMLETLRDAETEEEEEAKKPGARRRRSKLRKLKQQVRRSRDLNNP